MRKSIVIVGVKNAKRALETLGRSTVELFDGAAESWTKLVIQRELAGRQNYPAPRQGQRYVRTYQLGSGWRASRTRLGRWRIWNTQAYSVYVVGDSAGQGQAWMHRGRWWIARQRVDRHRPDLVGNTERLYVDSFNKWSR